MNYSISDIASLIGFPAMLAGFLYIGRKLQVLDDLKGTVDKIKNNLQVVTNYLTRHHEKFDAGELESYSPLRLTDEGRKFIERGGFADAFTQHKIDFLGFIEAQQPKLKYDVETAAIQSVYAMYEKPYMQFLKTFFYNNPSRNLGNVAPTLGVYVRDEYLAVHPEITA